MWSTLCSRTSSFCEQVANVLPAGLLCVCGPSFQAAIRLLVMSHAVPVSSRVCAIGSGIRCNPVVSLRGYKAYMDQWKGYLRKSVTDGRLCNAVYSSVFDVGSQSAGFKFRRMAGSGRRELKCDYLNGSAGCMYVCR